MCVYGRKGQNFDEISFVGIRGLQKDVSNCKINACFLLNFLKFHSSALGHMDSSKNKKHIEGKKFSYIPLLSKIDQI